MQKMCPRCSTQPALGGLLLVLFLLAGCIGDEPDPNDDDTTEPPEFSVEGLEVDTQEDTELAIELPAPSGDGTGLLGYALVSGPSHGSISGKGSAVTYTPALDFHGEDTFRFQVSQGTNNAQADVVITVDPVADAPRPTDDTLSVDEDTSAVLDVVSNDTDPEGDGLSLIAVGTAGFGDVEVEDGPGGTVRYTPDLNHTGADSFTYVIEDATGLTATGEVAVTVLPLSDSPLAADDLVTTDEDVEVLVAVLDNDIHPDGIGLALDSVGSATSGSTSVDGDQVLYVPDLDFHGTDSFTYTVVDPLGETDSATVTLTVSSVADAPSAVTDSVTVAEDGAETITPLSNDSDGDGDSFSLASVGGASNGSVTSDLGLGVVTYVPAADYFGLDSFSYTVEDSTGLSSTGVVNVTVTSVNDAPVGNDQTASVGVGNSVTIGVDGSDVDGDSLVFLVSGPPSLGTASTPTSTGPSSAEFVYSASVAGTDVVGVTVMDPGGGLDTLTVTVEVQAASVSLSGNHTFDTDLGELDGVAADGWDGSVWFVDDFTLSSGATLTVTGSSGLEITASGDVLVSGAIDLAGLEGGDVLACNAEPAGAGGSPGPGGYAGGSGGGPSPGPGNSTGADGQGPGGGTGGFVSVGRATGGGGGGHAVAGESGLRSDGTVLAPGGSPYSSLPPLQGGSGGGGGSSEPDGGPAVDDSGAGGGGGGGALSIVATGTIVVSSSALVDASGGDGGSSTCSAGGGSGGGGSGGAIELLGASTPTVSGTLDVSGGLGPGTNAAGGDGADGYIVTGTSS